MIKVAGEDICGFSEKRVAGDPAEGDDGLSERSAVRLDHGGRECGVSDAGARGHGGGPDSAGGEGAAGDGGGGGDGEPAAVGPVDGDEAVGGDCAGAGGTARGGAVRRADDDGGSADGASAGEI